MHLMKKTVSFLLAAFLGIFTLAAQERITVSGRVTDAETGEPLIAVGILQQGTSNGVISAMEGDYTITVPKGTVLLFSTIGYESVEVVADRSVIDVAMKVDTNLLDEVVVVGYGVQKKSSLTGAVSSVKSVDLEARGVTNINAALSGKTSGVQSYSSSARPGAAPNIQVRGIGSNGSSAPLYVIDGRVAAGTGALNPNDIESIEVLKDAASAAIYGASAGNGVILITTKKGKGDGHLSYDMQITSQSIAFKPHVMNSEQFVDYWTEVGSLSLETVLKNWDGRTNTDWMDATFEPSLMQKHSLTFQGGNEKGQFYLSGSYLDNNGMIKGKADVYKAYTGLINASYKIKSWLEVGTNNVIEYTQTKAVGEGGQGVNLFQSALGMYPTTKPTYTVDDMPDDMLKVLAPGANLGTLLGDGKGNYWGASVFGMTNRLSPFILRDRGINDNRSMSVSGTTYANLTPWQWLTVTSRLSYTLSAGEYYSADRKYFNSLPTGDYRPNMAVSSSNSDMSYIQWENFATAMKLFGKHLLTGMVGSSFSTSRSYSTSAGASGSLENPGWAYDDPNFLYIAYANDSVIKSIGGGEPSIGRKLAYFGRFNYSYADKYLFQASLRADAADSSVLPKDNRWGFFPAVSAGWVVSKEPFMDWSKGWLDQLKIRVSWGQNGSLASLGGYMYARTIGRTGRYNFSDVLNYTYGYAPSVMGNDNLKWETSEQLDLGIDLSLFGNRLTVSADWYDKETKDLLISGVKLSNTTGFSPSPINAGALSNKGVELEIGWQDHIGDFSYGIRGNMTTLKNKVKAVHENLSVVPGAGLISGTVFTRFEKGYPAWYFYGYQYEGVDPQTGDPVFKDINGGGVSDSDKTMIGKGIPDFTYGITLNAAWKGIDMVVFGSGVQGVDIYNVYDPNPEYIYNRLTVFTQDRWSQSNPNGTNPRAYADISRLNNSSYMVFDGSFFKIKQIQLGYTFPKSLLSKIRLENLRMYASLENFITFTKYPGWDPEVTGFGSAMGLDYGAYPNSRKVLFGLNITF